jgi:hypothetical protein
MLRSLYHFFTSIRLIVVCLALATILVFVGTLAQVEQGLYQAQARYFRSFLVCWSPAGTDWKIPVFPGGYLLGAVLVASLIANYLRRFKFARSHLGLLMIHLGLVLLLVGQLFTDLLSTESAMRLEPGHTRNYSEDFFAVEMAIVDSSDPQTDKVVSVPTSRLVAGATLNLPEIPLVLRVNKSWINADLHNRPQPGSEESGATAGAGVGRHVLGHAPTVKMDERNSPAATVEVLAGGKTLGTWLLSTFLEPQPFEHEGRSYHIALRPRRHYTDHQLTLLDLRHDVYKGTDIPRNFSSRVRLQNPRSGEDREVLIYMNNPLRYGGLTYYQYQMAATGPNKASTLQVVRNPGWLTPYLSCALIGIGLLVQFMSHLLAFLKERTP